MNSKLLKVLFESALFAAGSFPALCADAQTVEEEQSRLDDTLHHPWKFKFGAAIMSNSNSQSSSWKSGMDSAIVVVIVVVSIVSGLRCTREHKNILCCLRCHVEVPTLMTSSSSTVWKIYSSGEFASCRTYVYEFGRVTAFAMKDSRMLQQLGPVLLRAVLYIIRRGVTGFSQDPVCFPFDQHIINPCQSFLFFPYNFTGHICDFCQFWSRS